MFDTDNQDALDLHGHPMQGRFPYDKDRRILLEVRRYVFTCSVGLIVLWLTYLVDHSWGEVGIAGGLFGL